MGVRGTSILASTIAIAACSPSSDTTSPATSDALEDARQGVPDAPDDGSPTNRDASSPEPQPVSLTNPVYTKGAADPFILKVGRTWHAYVTGGKVPHLVSTDLATWTREGDAVPTINTKWIDPDDPALWAPSVAMIDETHFVLYYSPHVKGTPGRHCIGRAIADNPAGPFVDDSDEPLYCDDTPGHGYWSIDPSPFQDANGQRYLLWRQDDGDSHVAIRKMGPQGRQFEPDSKVTLIVDHTPGSWEDNSGSLGKLIENPAMIRSGGRYYVFYSGNSWQTDQYATGYAVCTSPVGPCVKKTKNAPWLATDGKMKGPGGLDFFHGPGGERWVAWHAWHGAVGPGKGTRQLFLGTFDIDDDGAPKIGEPVVAK